MDDHTGPLRSSLMPALPTLEDSKARLAKGLPAGFTRLVTALAAHPDPDEQDCYGGPEPASGPPAQSR